MNYEIKIKHVIHALLLIVSVIFISSVYTTFTFGYLHVELHSGIMKFMIPFIFIIACFIVCYYICILFIEFFKLLAWFEFSYKYSKIYDLLNTTIHLKRKKNDEAMNVDISEIDIITKRDIESEFNITIGDIK
ncbi:MAG: hypothetical protein KAS32_28420 [Candidatus Peribacteraceae bacterium]|nr:hypothetical protein [Candidatus Peribacteraceae bacterium]